ncbi:hypothetical protein LINGRAHAP2_LOCUS16803 [Linum grandiflorum]
MRARTNTLLRSPNFRSCWIETGWSKLSTSIGKATRQLTSN